VQRLELGRVLGVDVEIPVDGAEIALVQMRLEHGLGLEQLILVIVRQPVPALGKHRLQGLGTDLGFSVMYRARARSGKTVPPSASFSTET